MDLHRTEPEYTMQAVVDRTGVPADTIRSWERRHGFPSPARDAQNQRLYSERDVQSILRLKEQTALGTPVRDALRLLPDLLRGDPETHQTSDKQGDPAPASGRLAESQASGFDGLVEALLRFDGAEAKGILHTEMVTRPPEAVAFGSILRASRQLEGKSGAGARFGREFLRRVLVSLVHASDPDTGQNRIVLAGVPGCQLELLGLAHALAFSRIGCATAWLGLDADLGEVSEAIVKLDPLAVILIADDPVTVERAIHWWSHLSEVPSSRHWNGRRIIASPHRAARPATLTPNAPTWLPPEAGAAGILLDGLTIGPGQPVQIVSNQ